MHLSSFLMSFFSFFRNMSQPPSSTGSGASVNAGSLPVEPDHVDDRSLFWIYTTKIERIPGGGSWRFKCNFCNMEFVGAHNRVVSHLLKDGGKGVKACSKVTPQQLANMSKLLNDCKERVKNTAPKSFPLPSSSRNATTSSLDYDMSFT